LRCRSRLIDEQYLKTPIYGARKMAVVLSRSGHQVGRKRVMRLAVCCCCCRCEHVGNASDAEIRILPPQPPLCGLCRAISPCVRTHAISEG
jgi:hypothetical protein